MLEALTEQDVIDFAKILMPTKLKNVQYDGMAFLFSENHDYSINNQDLALRENNYLGTTQEYLVEYNNKKMAMVFQLYLNNQCH